jgi:hypothetical protein
MGIQETIERSFFEAVRILLVADNWTPDITNTTLFPNTETGFGDYITALKSIVTSKGYAVEVFGTSNPQDKGVESLPRITFETSAFLPGDIGVDTTPFPVLNLVTNKYDFYSYDSRSYDLYLDCKVSAKTQPQLRVLMDLIHRALPLMGNLTYYNDSADSFFVELTSFQTEVSPSEGVLEYNYRYEVPSIIWRELVKTETGVAPITEITLNLMIAERLGISTIIT